MISLSGASMSDLYPRILQHVLDAGEEVSPRGQATIEVSPFAFELTDPTQCLVLQKARKLNYAFVVAERLSLLTGHADPEMLCHYVSGLRQYVNSISGCFDGAYGPRVKPQLDYVYEELRRDPDSRRAVVSIYSAADQHDSVDVPCTLALQFLIRSGRLDLIVNMRSSDLYLGLPYDVSQFAFVQQVIAGWLSLPLGRYIHWTASAHIYATDVSKAERILLDPCRYGEAALPVPQLPKEASLDQLDLLAGAEKLIRCGASEENIRHILPHLVPEYEVWASVLAKSARPSVPLAQPVA